MKKLLITGIIGMTVFSIFYLFLFPISYEIDFYWYHVLECLEAHKEGYGISICSGFWHEPIEEDSPCFVNPWENPVEEVGHGSNLGSREIVHGYLQYLKTMKEEQEYNEEILDWWFETYAQNYTQKQSRQKLLNRCKNWRTNPNMLWFAILPIFGIIYLIAEIATNHGSENTTKEET